jgi:hypothetical protein
MNNYPKEWQKYFDAGWQIWPCSCSCGGKYAWVKPRKSGAFEMVGCICHSSPKIEGGFINDNV